MMIAAGEQGLPSRRTKRRRMKAAVFQAARSQPVQIRRPTGTAEGAGCSEADVVEKNDDHIRRPLGRAQRLDGRKPCIGVLGIVGEQVYLLTIGYRQDTAFNPWVL